MDAQCHVDQSAIAKPAHGCCPAPDGDGDSTPVTPADSQCAFCNLLIAHTDAPLILALTAIPEAVHAETITHDFQQAQEVNFAAAPNRAPPA